MPQDLRSLVQVVPHVGRARSDVPSDADGPRSGPAFLRAALLLSVATLLMDVVGAADARSTVLAIGALLSGSQLLTVSAVALVARRRSTSAGDPGCDLGKVEALVEFLSGFVLLALSMPVAYRAFGGLIAPSDCDTVESAFIIIAGLCSSALSAWLLLCAERGLALPRLDDLLAWSGEARHKAAHPSRSARGLIPAAAAGHVVDVQISAALLLAVLTASLCGWTWPEALAGFLGSFCMSFAGARLIVSSGAALVDARPPARSG